MEDSRCFFDLDPVILCGQVILRKMRMSDAPDMFEYSRLEDVTRYLLWSPHPSCKYTKKYLSSVMRQYRRHEFFDFAIQHIQDARMIGSCGFTTIDAVNNSAEIGYVIAPEYQGRHIASSVVASVLRFGFINLGFKRIEAKYMTGNVRSRAVMENNGMIYEGTRKQAMYIKGEYRDIGVCALTKDEYTALFGDSPVSVLRSSGLY